MKKEKVEILKVYYNKSEITLAKLLHGLHVFPPFSPIWDLKFIMKNIYPEPKKSFPMCENSSSHPDTCEGNAEKVML